MAGGFLSFMVLGYCHDAQQLVGLRSGRQDPDGSSEWVDGRESRCSTPGDLRGIEGCQSDDGVRGTRPLPMADEMRCYVLRSSGIIKDVQSARYEG